MSDFLLQNEGTIRLTVFLGLLGTMLVLEWLAPRRVLTLGRGGRWFQNFGVVVIDTLAVRAAFFFLPTLAVGFAVLMQSQGIGLLNLIDLPFWLDVVLAIIILDMIIYAQHVVFHHVPLFWRLHRVHHADMDIDATTALRFHPIEIVLSMMLKLAAIALLGAPAVAVLIFEIVLNGMAIFNHANLSLPRPLDRLLRLLVITPDVHRVHHSIIVEETNSNFGFNLSLWDRVFGTYRAQPKAGHQGMEIGLEPYRDGDRQGFLWMLALPFRK